MGKRTHGGAHAEEEEDQAHADTIKLGLRFLLSGRDAEEEEGENEGLRSLCPRP